MTVVLGLDVYVPSQRFHKWPKSRATDGSQLGVLKFPLLGLGGVWTTAVVASWPGFHLSYLGYGGADLGQDHRVVALDQRGHGETDKPNSGFEFASVTQDILGVMDCIGGDHPIVIGHSWGGSVALELAVRAPDSVKGMVGLTVE
ncbi:MAG: hypothetical protein CM1200mP27_09120 [Chloroflexota bacterium]|nr:MAG: hypothetical protein CM1200mP27_09120 [Chloroflexota bacterium]